MQIGRQALAFLFLNLNDRFQAYLLLPVNFLLQSFFIRKYSFVTFELAQEAVKRAIKNYNTLRPHGSCNYHTPDEAHKMAGELPKKWRKTKADVIEKIQPSDHKFATQNQP